MALSFPVPLPGLGSPHHLPGTHGPVPPFRARNGPGLPALPARHALIRAKHALIRRFWGFSRRRKTQLIALFLRPIFSQMGSCTLYGKREAVFERGRSGALEVRSGRPVSPTEKFPGAGCRLAKMCQKRCTFTHFFGMRPICSPIAKIRGNCGAVKP